jgi:hypothetical protein
LIAAIFSAAIFDRRTGVVHTSIFRTSAAHNFRQCLQQTLADELYVRMDVS